MACDQIEYCGSCPHYESCEARKGKDVEPPCSKEEN